MTMYRHILIATGGAEHSRRAEQRAVKLAQFANAKLSLVSVLRNEAKTADVPQDTRTRIQESIIEKATERCQEYGITPETHLRMGHAGKCIIETAKELDCDLIVVGNRQLSLVGVMTQGSISDYVIRHTNTDVLTVL